MDFHLQKKCYTYHAHFGYSIKTSRKRYVGRPNFTPENTKIFDQYNSNQLSNGRGGSHFYLYLEVQILDKINILSTKRKGFLKIRNGIKRQCYFL